MGIKTSLTCAVAALTVTMHAERALAQGAPEGACCLPTGGCGTGPEFACDAALGVYQGDGTTCVTVECPDLQACCLIDVAVQSIDSGFQEIAFNLNVGAPINLDHPATIRLDMVNAMDPFISPLPFNPPEQPLPADSPVPPASTKLQASDSIAFPDLIMDDYELRLESVVSRTPNAGGERIVYNATMLIAARLRQATYVTIPFDFFPVIVGLGGTVELDAVPANEPGFAGTITTQIVNMSLTGTIDGIPVTLNETNGAPCVGEFEVLVMSTGDCTDLLGGSCEAVGGLPLGPDTDCDTAFCFERAHPGWNRVSAEITLTPNQPTYWSAFSGLGSNGGLNPITVPPFPSLDPDPTGDQPGRPCPTFIGERCLRGYIVAWAVDENNQEKAYNHLAGSATTVNYPRALAWEYGAWGHQAVGAVAGDGVLNLDGTEYSPGFDLLLLDFYRPGSSAFSGLESVFNGAGLTLHPLDLDAQQGSTPVTTKAVIDVWNENEVKFDNLDRCITCWDDELFARYAGVGVPNNFINLQTDKGKARIDGRAGDGICDIFDETEGPCGTLSSDVCGQDAALTGVVTQYLTFADQVIFIPGGPTTANSVGPHFAATAKNLVGMGTQDATVLYTPLAPPPTATAPDRGRAADRAALERSRRRTPLPAAAAGSPTQDRISGTEKASLLFISKVELRWGRDDELVQDTFISLINDGNETVKVQMEFINGDPPLEEAPLAIIQR